MSSSNSSVNLPSSDSLLRSENSDSENESEPEDFTLEENNYWIFEVIDQAEGDDMFNCRYKDNQNKIE